MLSCQSELFSLPDDCHYLNCASRSPLLRASEAAAIKGLLAQRVPMPSTPEEYFAQPDQLRAVFAQLIGCDAARVAITPSVSYGVAIAAHNLKLDSTQQIVVVDEEFPSDVYAWIEACKESGARLTRVARAGSESAWTERLLETIDTSTALVSLSSVHWTDGSCFDVQAVADRCREVGALFVLDGTQSIGALPFDYEQVRPDLLVVASYKWLFGPYQLGLAVVGDRLLDGRPFENHWSTRAGSEDTSNTSYQPNYRPGARRFDVGEFNNTISIPILLEGIAQVSRWTPVAIQEYCANLATRLENLDSKRYTVPTTADSCAHILGIRLRDPNSIGAVISDLNAHKIQVSKRGEVLRVSPNVYNTTDDIDALTNVLNSR